MRVRKRPIECEAIEFTGSNGAEVKAWVNERAQFNSSADQTWFVTKGMTASTGGQAWRYIKSEGWTDKVAAAIYDHLSGGWLPVLAGDWILYGTKGEFWPVDPGVFVDSYEILGEPGSGRLEGHGLGYEGAPHDDKGNRTSPNRWGGVGGKGRAKCACGELSPVLDSAYQRKKWHREHKAQVASR